MCLNHSAPKIEQPAVPVPDAEKSKNLVNLDTASEEIKKKARGKRGLMIEKKPPTTGATGTGLSI